MDELHQMSLYLQVYTSIYIICIHIHTYTACNAQFTKYGKGVYGVHIPVETHVYL